MKKLNRNIAIIYIQILVLSLLTSCKKFVEIPPPQSQLVTTSVFKDNATGTSAELAIYTKMVSNNESQNMSLQNGLLADELKYYGSSLNTKVFYLNAMNLLNAAGSNVGPWSSAYNYIYQSNAIIDNLKGNTKLSPAVIKQLTGESLFLRAFWHFYLTNLYGDVPLALTSDYAVTSKLSRTPRLKVLQQVIKDLTDAHNLLNKNYVDASDTGATSDRVRPNKAVAAALIARTYLYLGDYDNKNQSDYHNAEAWADTVIGNSAYSLVKPLTETDYVFNISNNSEAIWQLATPSPASNGATTDGQAFILISQPNNVALSSQLLDSFEPGDNRKSIWVGSYTTTTAPINTFHFPYKYKERNSPDVTEYIMVLRLAEQYLIRAETRAEEGETANAIADINVIRNRAGLANYSGATDKASLLAAILHERQVEFFCEWGHRWFDLNRTGNTNAVMSIVNPLKGGIWSNDGHQMLYPIPVRDISVNPNLIQNPGY